MGYKTTDALMRHLRETGIDISGSTEKRQLINTGYFHGYKGYRFFKSSDMRIPFTSYKEIYATIQYDSELKSLLYGKMMFIETAVKNIALEGILNEVNSESIQKMFEKAVSGYNNAPANASAKLKYELQQNKLDLQKIIQSSLATAYRAGNPVVTHFYNNASYSDVPIWALFEILNLGNFGKLLSCLTYAIRDKISKELGFNLSCDTDRVLIYKYIYALKDLRNAIAHNAVVFDGRFRTYEPNKAMKQCLRIEIGLPYVNFRTIGDYVILMCYYLKLLKVPKSEINQFIRSFEKITEKYRSAVSPDVAAIVIHQDLDSRMRFLKSFI